MSLRRALRTVNSEFPPVLTRVHHSLKLKRDRRRHHHHGLLTPQQLAGTRGTLTGCAYAALALTERAIRGRSLFTCTEESCEYNSRAKSIRGNTVV